MMKTTASLKPAEVEKKWIVIDAENAVVGRLATFIANRLRGKHRADYTPHVDCGDFVVVVNADKVKFTGRKLEQKTYQSYSHYPGGQKIVAASDLMDKHSDRILMSAIKRMVPRTRLQPAAEHHPYAGMRSKSFNRGSPFIEFPTFFCATRSS